MTESCDMWHLVARSSRVKTKIRHSAFKTRGYATPPSMIVSKYTQLRILNAHSHLDVFVLWGTMQANPMRILPFSINASWKIFFRKIFVSEWYTVFWGLYVSFYLGQLSPTTGSIPTKKKNPLQSQRPNLDLYGLPHCLVRTKFRTSAFSQSSWNYSVYYIKISSLYFWLV